MVSHKNNDEGCGKKAGVLSGQILAGLLLVLLGCMSGMADVAVPLTAPAMTNASMITADKVHNLTLAAVVPTGLSIAAGDISWQIRTADGKVAQQLVGRSPQLFLPVGQYEVSLRIGTYEEHQRVDVVADRVTDSTFTPNIGRLRASSEAEADWKIIARQGGVGTGAAILNQATSPQISAIVAAGDYAVVATLQDGVSDTQQVKVLSGQVSNTKIQMPTGKVSLIATLGNGPALRPMSWTVYRLDGGRQTIATPRRHSATLVVSPGHYEAVASLDGQERRRAFTVLTNTTNRIVVAMD